jgi:hypothetical protein
MKRATEAHVSANLFELGLGHVVVTRFRGDGEAELGVFLVDVNCLGVKDAYFARVTQFEYDRELLDRILPADNRKPLDPPSARKLVEDAVAYAGRLGLAPHPDHKKACRVFGGIDPAASTANFTFGREGKPFYVQGKYDSFERCLQILRQLRARCGEDNFDFLAVGGERETETLAREGFKIRQKVPVPPEEQDDESQN